MVVYKANMVQRGHAFAIVDEVDSILIDEARTPLIISGKGEDSSVMYKRADDFAKTLKKSVIVELDDKVEAEEQVDGDYVVDEKRKTATLTESGVKKAEAFFHVENLADATICRCAITLTVRSRPAALCTAIPTISSKTVRSSSLTSSRAV